MPVFGHAAAQARLAMGLPAFFQRRISLEEGRRIVRRRLADRESLFLRLARPAIFDNPHSPYRWLFDRAGIGCPDLEAMLKRDGLEATLTALRRARVSVSFEEFKGRVPIVRDGVELRVTAQAFDNPVRKRYFSGTTGGSTGTAVRLAIDLDHISESAPGAILALEANGLSGTPIALWRSILPAVAAISSILRGVTMGCVPERWFSPLGPDEVSAPLKDRIATAFIVRAGRLAGAPLPLPEYVPFDRAIVVARWARDAVARGGRASVRGHVSSLARIALAAEEAGIDLTGTVLWGGGEPPTATKVASIVRSGAIFRPTYFLSEAGAIGLPCCNPADPTDVHVMEDAIAVVGDQPWSEQPRQMLWLTTLLATAPKVMLNVETDDVAIVERRECGCALAAAGFGTHIRQVRSARKLTSEGMRVLGIDVLALVEEFLPATFGGSALHYQVAEEEDAGGQTRVVVVVDPQIALPDEAAARNAVLGFLRSRGDRLAASTWTRASSLVIRRETPRWSSQGKLPVLRAVRAASYGVHA